MRKCIDACLTVVLLWLVSACCPKEETVRVGSYNIRLDASVDYSHNDGWNQRRDILCDLIRFEDFDIFGCQEVTKPQLDDMLERLPGYSYVGVGRDDGKEAGEYSPVFFDAEQFTLLDSGTFWLSETPDSVSFGWDAACRRVCSWAKLRIKHSHKVIWAFNTHMDHIGVQARTEGAKLILAKVNEIAGPKANVVVSGDFNVDQFSEAAKSIQASGRLIDSYELAQTRFAPGGTFNSWDPTVFTPSRIDHVFVSSDLKVLKYGILTNHYWGQEVLDSATLKAAPDQISGVKKELHNPSDHYPICIEIAF